MLRPYYRYGKLGGIVWRTFEATSLDLFFDFHSRVARNRLVREVTVSQFIPQTSRSLSSLPLHLHLMSNIVGSAKSIVISASFGHGGVILSFF
jgi:hypothetical protein